jgi:hypothetical protein
VNALVFQLEEASRELGRLRRRIPADGYDAHLVDRIGAHLDIVDSILQPSAAELVASGETVDMALAEVDARARRVRTLLGEKPR